MRQLPRRRLALACALLLSTVAPGLTACADRTEHPLAFRAFDAAARLAVSGHGADGLDPARPLVVRSASAGDRITDVTAVDQHGRHVGGRLSADGSHWLSTAGLSGGARYTVRVGTEDTSGARGRGTLHVHTRKFPGKQQTLGVELGPRSGTYGVGQPIRAKVGKRVTDPDVRAAVVRALRVDSSPGVEGAWRWINDRELHYRPRDYWPAGTRITVRTTELTPVRAGHVLRLRAPGELRLRIGADVRAVTDAAGHEMTVWKNGELLRTIPVTTGKPGFETRNGVKVILDEEAKARMRSATIGIKAGSKESYDLQVRWATRLTESGEFVHAAPWSVGAQGSANVSHGCTGMSTENAHWFFERTRPGDVVVVEGSDGKEMEPFGNGYGDWNLSWRDWQGTTPPSDRGRLRIGA
ncbi:L,D-transpeptidase [Streptomyces sp. A7024]|uniref:L,D-transpeptidase n=1 Tax=Streptomyces coryli TaxID=1128680 RepID=A0A6G4TS42_9ACTN|nr:Ig-like domain-containing protein [Streptomyces coryli]NGN62296.1 L,D-transpeptidase [Streptomyces coryli]